MAVGGSRHEVVKMTVYLLHKALNVPPLDMGAVTEVKEYYVVSLCRGRGRKTCRVVGGSGRLSLQH